MLMVELQRFYVQLSVVNVTSKVIMLLYNQPTATEDRLLNRVPPVRGPSGPYFIGDSGVSPPDGGPHLPHRLTNSPPRELTEHDIWSIQAC